MKDLRKARPRGPGFPAAPLLILSVSGLMSYAWARPIETAPSGPIVFVSSSSIGTSTSPITFHIHFTQSVTGFSAAGVSVGNGTKSSFSGSGGDYEVQVTPSLQGEVTCSVPANVAKNSSNEWNFSSNVASITYDTTPPSATVSAQVSVTNIQPVYFFIQFSDPVWPFSKAGLTLTGGSVPTEEDITWYGMGYQDSCAVRVIPWSIDGTVTCQVKANATENNAGLKNLLSNTAQVKYDAKNPPVSLSTASASTNAFPIQFNAFFNEPVTGLSMEDFLIGNGTPAFLTQISSQSYTLQVAPTDQGPVTVQLPAGSARDVANNGNDASAMVETIYDSISPVASLASSTMLTNSTSILFSIAFSEEVTGMTEAGLEITNGAAGGLTGGGKDYAFWITPASDGVVTCALKPGAAKDAAGNPSLASNTASVVYDGTAPGAPMSLSALPLSSSSVRLTWTASFDSAQFIIDRSLPDGSYEEIGTLSASQYLDRELEAGTLYRYRIRAIDAAGNQSEHGFIQVRTSILTELAYGDGDAIWGWGSTNPEDPFNTSWPDSRTQFVVLASELKAAGLDSGDFITEIRFQCSQGPGLPKLPLMNIRMKHTADSTIMAFHADGWTPVFERSEVAAREGEWTVLALQPGFLWNGQDNLQIEIARDGIETAAGGGIFVRTGAGVRNRMYAGFGGSGFATPFDQSLVEEQQQALPKLQLAYNPAERIASNPVGNEEGGGGNGGGGCGLVGLDALLMLAILTLRRRRKETIR